MRTRLFAVVLCLASPVLLAAQAPDSQSNAAGVRSPQPAQDGVLYADKVQALPGNENRGIAKSIEQCASQTHACMIQAPALYSLAEEQPFGGAPNNFAPPIVRGPKASQPTAAFMDMRYGVPQWIFNQSRPLSNRFLSSPAFTMTNITGPGPGLYAHYADALKLQSFAFAGGRNSNESLGDKTNFATFETTSYRYTQAQGGGDLAQVIYCIGNGDCVGHAIDTFGYGNQNAQGDEGNESMRYEATEGGQVFKAVLGSVTTGPDGSATITTTSQSGNGFQGEGRLLVDLSKKYSEGYISAFSNAGNNEIVTCSDRGTGCDWDRAFGTSVQTRLTAAVSNAAGASGASATTFPQSNVSLAVTSSNGFRAGQLACIFDIDYECEKVASVPDGAHITLATARVPHPVNSLVTAGGLAGYGIEFEADRAGPGAMNGLAANPDSAPTSLIRNVIPIMFNSTGSQAALFQGGGVMPGQGGGYSGRAYAVMGSCSSGARCTASATVSGGQVTSCNVSGGTGFANANMPPQLLLSGITATTPPVIYVSGVSSGALTACSVANPGAGVSGNPTVTVVPANPYDIYPAAKVMGVYNAAVGQVDGTLQAEPLPEAFSSGDSLEQPHYFVQHYRGANNVIGSYIPSLVNVANGGQGVTLTGLWQGNDQAVTFTNSADPTIYKGYPAATPYMFGRGQVTAPYGLLLSGVFGAGIALTTPPLPLINGLSGAVVVRCGKLGCPNWTSAYNLIDVQGNGANDAWSYTPATRSFNLSMGLVALVSAGKSYTINAGGTSFNFGPSGNVPVVSGQVAAGHIAVWSNATPPTLVDGGPLPGGGSSAYRPPSPPPAPAPATGGSRAICHFYSPAHGAGGLTLLYSCPVPPGSLGTSGALDASFYGGSSATGQGACSYAVELSSSMTPGAGAPMVEAGVTGPNRGVHLHGVAQAANSATSVQLAGDYTAGGNQAGAGSGGSAPFGIDTRGQLYVNFYVTNTSTGGVCNGQQGLVTLWP